MHDNRPHAARRTTDEVAALSPIGQVVFRIDEEPEGSASCAFGPTLLTSFRQLISIDHHQVRVKRAAVIEGLPVLGKRRIAIDPGLCGFLRVRLERWITPVHTYCGHEILGRYSNSRIVSAVARSLENLIRTALRHVTVTIMDRLVPPISEKTVSRIFGLRNRNR